MCKCSVIVCAQSYCHKYDCVLVDTNQLICSHFNLIFVLILYYYRVMTPAKIIYAIFAISRQVVIR